MYRITRVALKHSKDSNPTQTNVFNIDCTNDELMIRVLPKLKKLASAENLTYRKINSDTRIQYQVVPISANTLDAAITKIGSLIAHNVMKYNEEIASMNRLIKRANAKAKSVGAVNDMHEFAKLSDYNNPFERQTTYLLLGETIVVSEEEYGDLLLKDDSYERVQP
jgi:hypothetical protein